MVGMIEREKIFTSYYALEEMGKRKDFKLVIVGKRGWCVEELSKRIKNHKQLNKNLFWIEDCSDEFLIELYESCSGLIAASWAEVLVYLFWRLICWFASFLQRHCTI